MQKQLQLLSPLHQGCPRRYSRGLSTQGGIAVTTKRSDVNAWVCARKSACTVPQPLSHLHCSAATQPSASRPSIALSLRAQHTMALWWPLYVRMASPVVQGAQHSAISGGGQQAAYGRCAACRQQAAHRQQLRLRNTPPCSVAKLPGTFCARPQACPPPPHIQTHQPQGAVQSWQGAGT